ncbi:MAG TPA: hypothetical protein VGF69_04045 [Thermoanaerobaculia bacterium]|jgi:hypothetical protein
MIRRSPFTLLVLLTLVVLAARVRADFPTPSVPPAPFYGRTITLAPGEQFALSDALSASSSTCDRTGTTYTLLVTNGNQDGSGKIATGRVGVNGEDYCGTQLDAGQATVSVDVPMRTVNTVDMDVRAPATSAAVVKVEIWRHPVLPLLPPSTLSVPANTTKSAEYGVDGTEGTSAILKVTRNGALTAADDVTFSIDGTNVVTKADFTNTSQTITKTVNLGMGSSMTVTGKAGTTAASLNFQIDQLGDTSNPVIELGSPHWVTSTSPYTITGSVGDQTGFTALLMNGTKIPIAADGTFSASATLKKGWNNLEFVVYDCAGNAASASHTIAYDTDAPVATVTSHAPNAFVKTTTLTVKGTAVDDGPTPPTIKVNGITATKTFGGTWTAANVPIPSGDGPKTLTIVATDTAQHSSTTTLQVVLDATPPVITGSVTPAPSLNGWRPAGTRVTFDCTDAGSGIATCSEPVTRTASGAQSVAGTATDKAGNQATTSIAVQIDADAPLLTITTHPAAVNQAALTLTGTVSDAHSGLLSVTCGSTAASLTGNAFTCSTTLLPGNNEILVTAVDHTGNEQRATAAVKLDDRAPLLTIDDPETGAVVNGSQIVIKGTVSDNDEVATVRVNGTSVAFDDGAFSTQLTLVPGNNSITAEATDRGGNVTARSITVTRFIVPTVSITSPADLAVLRDTTATITGTVSDPAASVTVNGVTASTANGNFTAAGIPLQQGRTVITANAVTPSGGTATTSINIYRDSIPPRLEVYSPADGTTVHASPVSISGMVDDIVVGTINSQQMRVKVNGIDAEVSNRAFLMRNVALSPGLNTFSITATDEGGNSTVVAYNLTYVPAPPQPHLEIVSGNGQSGRIGTALAAPLVARAVAPDGSPIAGALLTFGIDNNDGTVSDGVTTAGKVTVPTDAQGRAQVQWILGNRAGAGNHRVQVRATGYAAPVEATAAATTGDPKLIVVDSGNNQFGVASDALPRPLIAIVVDAGNNRLANVPVTFTVAQGGGNFDGQPSIVAVTDSDGRAIVRPTLGPEPGEDNNVFSATVTAVNAASTFVASGRAAGPPASTRITGVVLDNTSIALAGVSVRIDGTQLYTQTDANGQFTITGAPVGYVKLFIDGSTAQRPGTWPTLEYALYTLPGVENSVGMPIYLVQLDTARGLFVDDTTGGTLTLPELPGFALEVKPGSATFPGGGRTGTVSATLVHADRIPMAPGFGQQPKFIVTIQPPGTHFDPPARLTLPNTDGLTPGASTEMYSFDHDLGQFVTIGSATVSPDGSVIKSDPGVGIIKGGWHGGGDPVPGGGGSDCEECSMAVGESCGPDPAMEGGACEDDNIPATIDLCLNGQPKHIVPTLQVEVTSESNFIITAEPRMPKMTARVRVYLEGREVDASQYQFEWDITIKYEPELARVPRQHVVHTYAMPHSFDYDLRELWRGGTLEFKAFLMRRSGAQTVRTTSAQWPRKGAQPVVIRGANPTRDTVFAQVESEATPFVETYKLILCEETREFGVRQFDDDPGLPVLGDDDNRVTWGVGMAQLTATGNERPIARDLYWHWARNLSGGIAKFREKYQDALDYPDNVRERFPNANVPNLTPAQLEIEALQRYNGGVYHRFTPARGWHVDPANGYADRVRRLGCN